jgi:hypothetical protein
MDAAKTLDDGPFERCDLVRFRYIGADRRDDVFAAFGKCGHFASGFDKLVSFLIAKHDREAKSGKFLRCGKADAGSGSGDDGDIVLFQSGMSNGHGSVSSMTLLFKGPAGYGTYRYRVNMTGY